MGYKFNFSMDGLLSESTWLHIIVTLINSRISSSNACLISSESCGVKFQSRRLWVQLGINKHHLWILLNLKPIYQTPSKYAFNVMYHINSIIKWNYVVLYWTGKMDRYNGQRILFGIIESCWNRLVHYSNSIWVKKLGLELELVDFLKVKFELDLDFILHYSSLNSSSCLLSIIDLKKYTFIFCIILNKGQKRHFILIKKIKKICMWNSIEFN